MAPAGKQFAEILEPMAFAAPRVPVFSNVTAAPYAGSEQIPGLLAEQLVHEVCFVHQVESMYQAVVRVFLELGPDRLLSKLVNQILEGHPHRSISLQRRGENGIVQFLHALAGLAAEGLEVDLERLYQGRSVRDLGPALEAASANDAAIPSHAWLVNGGEARPASQPSRAAAPIPAQKSDTPRVAELAAAAGGERAPSLPRPFLQVAPLRRVETRPDTFVARLPEANGNGSIHGTGGGERDASLPPEQQTVSSTASKSSNGSTPGPYHKPEQTFESPFSEREPMSPTKYDAFAQFQETMRQFLATQQRTFEVFFQGTEQAEPVSPASTSRPSMPVASAAAPAPAAERFAPAMLEASRMMKSNGHAPIEPATAPMEPAQAAAEPRFEPVPERSVPAPQAVVAEAAQPDVTGPPPQSAGPDPQQILLEITAEQTGYPIEMLALDANLEADLGVNSIKRVEIIGTFRRAAVPSLKEPPAWYAQEAGSVRSLQDILNIVKRLQASCPREDGQTAAPAAAEPAVVHGAATRQYRVSRARRCVCRVVEVPMDDAEPELPDGALLLIDDCRGLAAEVAAAAKLRGYATCVLAPRRWPAASRPPLPSSRSAVNTGRWQASCTLLRWPRRPASRGSTKPIGTVWLIGK